MIPLTPTTRVFLAAGNTDLRKSFEGLADLVAHSLKENPLSGHLHVFANRLWPRSGPAPREKIPCSSFPLRLWPPSGPAPRENIPCLFPIPSVNSFGSVVKNPAPATLCGSKKNRVITHRRNTLSPNPW